MSPEANARISRFMVKKLRTMQVGSSGLKIDGLEEDWTAGVASAPGGRRRQRQANPSEIRASVNAFPLVPALKATLARRYGNPGWSRVRPLDEASAERLHAGPGTEAIGCSSTRKRGLARRLTRYRGDGSARFALQLLPDGAAAGRVIVP